MMICKVKDHIDAYNNIAMLNNSISRRDVCDCQNDIYGIKNLSDNSFLAIVLGHRVYDTTTVVSPTKKEVIKNSYFLFKYFAIGANEVSFKMLAILLAEFLADKNDMPVKYYPTGTESENMISALLVTGFKKNETEGCYIRVPKPKILRRY